MFKHPLSKAAAAVMVLAISSPAGATASIRAPLEPQQAAKSAFPSSGWHDSFTAGGWHDSIRTDRPGRARNAWVTVGHGERYTFGSTVIKVVTAPSYGNGASVQKARRAWATYFNRLPHGREMNSLTISISPFTEMQIYCGAQADSCYGPGEATIYLVGETPPDGADIRQIAAHEYGHHVASNRRNSPWEADTWGPKFWASAREVCANTRTRFNSFSDRSKPLMYPGDEGRHYNDNPAEVWAETYRIVASDWMGITPDPWEYDPHATPPKRGLGLNPLWKPTPAMLAAARRDVFSPWQSDRRRVWTGSFRGGGPSSKVVPISVTLDGRLTASLSSARGLRTDLQLTDARGRALTGHTDVAASPSLRNDVCSMRTVKLRIHRHSGNGRWRLVVRDPGR